MKTATLLFSQDYLKNMTDMAPPGQGLGVSQSWAPDGTNPSFCSWKRPAKRGTPWRHFRTASLPQGPKVFDHQILIYIYIYIYNLSINCNLQISINLSVFDALMTGHSAPQPGWWPCYLGLGAGTHHHVFIVRMSSHLLCRIYLVQPLARAQAGVSKGPGVETCLSKSWRCLKAWIGWLNFWVTSVSCSSMGCVKVCKMHVFMLMHTLCGQGTGQGWTIQSQKEEQHQEDEADEHDYIQ